jgi:hypothetical protein
MCSSIVCDRCRHIVEDILSDVPRDPESFWSSLEGSFRNFIRYLKVRESLVGREPRKTYTAGLNAKKITLSYVNAQFSFLFADPGPYPWIVGRPEPKEYEYDIPTDGLLTRCQEVLDCLIGSRYADEEASRLYWQDTKRRRKFRPFTCPECGELLRREGFCKRKRCIDARTFAGWPPGRLWAPDYTIIKPEIIPSEKWDALHASWLQKYTRPVDKKGDPSIRVFKGVFYYDEEIGCWTRSYKKCAYWLWSAQAKEYFNRRDKKQKVNQLQPFTSIMPSGCTKKSDAQEWVDNEDYVTTAPRIERVPAIFDDDEYHEKDEYSEISLASAEQLSACVEDNILNQVFQARVDDCGSSPAKSSVWTHVCNYKTEEQRPNYECFSEDPVQVVKYDHPKFGPCERTETLEKCTGNGGASAPKWTPEKNRGIWMVNLEQPAESAWQFWEDQINEAITRFAREHPKDTEFYEPPPIIRQDREGRLVGQKLSMDRRTTVSKPGKPEELDHLVDLYRRRRDAGTLTNKDEIVLRSYFDQRTNAKKGAEVGKTKEGFRSMVRRYGQPMAGLSEAFQKMLDEKGRGWFVVVKLSRRRAYLYKLDIEDKHATDEDIQASKKRGASEEWRRMAHAEVERVGAEKFVTNDVVNEDGRKLIHDTRVRVESAFKRGHLIGSFDCDPQTCTLCSTRSLTAPAARVRETRKLVKTLIHTFAADGKE